MANKVPLADVTDLADLVDLGEESGADFLAMEVIDAIERGDGALQGLTRRGRGLPVPPGRHKTGKTGLGAGLTGKGQGWRDPVAGEGIHPARGRSLGPGGPVLGHEGRGGLEIGFGGGRGAPSGSGPRPRAAVG